nr:winged helix-turn-helix domain-containing protein [Woeseiaceae bacterium]
MADSKRSGARQLKVGDWHVDGNALTASNGDERRAIEPRAYKVLCYLADRPGDVVTIDELMDALWGGSVVTPNAVTRVIAHLRKVLDEDARNPKYIETVARTGYRYIAAPAQPRPSTRLRSVALAGAALAALGALLLLWLAPAPEDAAPSIAVLPFENLTGDPAQDFLGEGISEEIIAALTGLPDISVSARTESFRFRDGDADPVNVARELDVSWIVAGSVRRVNHDVRLTAQLINPVTGNHLWSLTDERDIAQLFDGQDAVSRGVLQALAKHAGLDTEIVMPAVEHAPDAKAYELYMRGRYIWHRRGTEPLQPAIDLFREAVEIDPDF